MEKRVLATFLLVLLVGLVAGACDNGDDEPTVPPPPTATNTPTAEVTQPPDATDTPTAEVTQTPVNGKVVNITLTENPFTFQPDGYDFKVGTTYALTFSVPGDFHTFTIEKLGIDIFINAGDSVQQEITFDTAGTYKLICVPHEALGMVGEIRVS